MALGYPSLGFPLTYESQPFGPADASVASLEPAMYANGSTVAYWQPYKGWAFYPHYHNGLDIAGPAGTPLHAMETGRVLYAGWRNNGGGYVVEVEIRSGTSYTFNHCLRTLVHANDIVLKGQTIAEIGMTGTATGNHCHVSLDINETMDGYPRTLMWNPKLFMGAGAYAGDNRIVSTYAGIPDTTIPPPPTGTAVVTAGGLPVTFVNRSPTGSASIIAGKPRRAGASLAAKNYGASTKDQNFPIWGEVKGQDFGSGARWFFGAQYIGAWRVVYIPLVDLKNRTGL